MPWEFPSPWNWILTTGMLLILGIAIFWLSIQRYERRYFTGKALQLALLRTLGWLAWYGGSILLVYWLTGLFLPSAWLHYLAAGGLWWLLSETILAWGWELFDRLLEVL
jgi:hypothetical protein